MIESTACPTECSLGETLVHHCGGVCAVQPSQRRSRRSGGNAPLKRSCSSVSGLRLKISFLRPPYVTMT
ncbi:hypothetical protein M3J09_011324 [Ascochyta lentis]